MMAPFIFRNIFLKNNSTFFSQIKEKGRNFLPNSRKHISSPCFSNEQLKSYLTYHVSRPTHNYNNNTKQHYSQYKNIRNLYSFVIRRGFVIRSASLASPKTLYN